MMMKLRKRHLALAIMTAIALAGCADDGADGADGAPGPEGPIGPEGPGYKPPVVEVAETTKVNVIEYAIQEGQVTFVFEVTDENGHLVVGLEDAEAKFAVMTSRGVIQSREGEGSQGGRGDLETEGASLEVLGDGHYKFVLPMANIDPAQDGILWLRVGSRSGDIGRSQPLVLQQPEGLHSTTTQACFSCHVDYATGLTRHTSYTAIDADGEAAFIDGCMVCHNSVTRADEEGGYATNTLSKIGHINHQEFEEGFNALNCFTCHTDAPINTNFTGPGCIDCHGQEGTPTGDIIPANGIDLRKIHADKVGLTAQQSVRSTHKTTSSAPYWDAAVTWTDDVGAVTTGAVCTDLKLYLLAGEGEQATETQLNIGELYADHTLTYAGAYIHGYDSDNKTIVGRAISRGAEQYVERADGTRSICFPGLVAGFESANLIASTRLTFGMGVEDEELADDSAVSFTTYSDVVSTDYYDIDLGVTAPTFTAAGDYERRHGVSSSSCTTCHNNEANLHRNGSFQNGGYDCVACHNNGQDRRAGNSGPGFGPMVHSMHWGVGSTDVDENGDEITNAAGNLNPANCVVCHSEVVDLNSIPNQYIRARAYGVDNKMASPTTANCYACHISDQALNHMVQNGGEIDVDVGEDWFTVPTAESCATCHAEGRTFGIEQYHVFER